MKRILATFVLMLLCVSMSACGEESKGTQIPDIWGISYVDAMEILKADGFEVSAIEAEVGNISEKLLYPLEKVSKGTVFKVDNYILDNLGNLTKNYDIFRDGEFVSEDKSIVIYYAKEDYVLEKENAENDHPTMNDMDTQETVEQENTGNNSSTTNGTDAQEPSENKNLPEASATTEKKSETNSDDTGLDADFKAAMDSYEKFMDEYVSFMKKYQDNPGNLDLLTDYADYLTKYADFVEDFEGWESGDMNSAETAYYIEVQSRVSKKLLEVAS